MFQANVVEKVKTYFMFNTIFPKIVPLWDNMEKYGTARQATHDNLMRRKKDGICIPDN
jgi:hypothetical protein